jgi:polysaccharide biosynthesis transport protein
MAWELNVHWVLKSSIDIPRKEQTVQPSQFSISEIAAAMRRRASLLLIPPLLITGLAIVAVYKMPRMYESYTTILVQRNEMQNPLTSLSNQTPSYLPEEDPLRYIDEIIYSRKTVGMLMDSLHIPYGGVDDAETRRLVDDVKGNIKIVRSARESFAIAFTDTDPHRAQRGAAVLTNIFIQTTSSTNNKRNDVTVQFYEQKLEEFRVKLEQSQEQIMPNLRQRASDNPAANAYLNDVQRQIRDIEQKNRDYAHNLVSIKALPPVISTKQGRVTLFELSRLDLPYASDLKSLLTKYDDVSARYSSQHPEVAKIENEITEVLDRMTTGITSETEKASVRLADLRRTQSQIITEILGSTQRVGQEQESNLAVYQRLYDGMKVKLEEAQVQQAIGKNADNQFSIIDPSLVPLRPTKPNRAMIVGGGFAVGLLLGLVAAVLAELFDTTIRTTRAIEIYEKPIIAFLPERARLPE